ncbi:MAG TPA: hypothetical protein VMS29_09720 [Pyrinomonadaceae bacterium]|nr:hypothetical protein [Pyrinomonadaceae bacterium]
MMKHRVAVYLFVVFSLSLSTAAQKIEISLKNNTPAETKTKAQLERLIAAHDLTKWTFTRKVEIDEKAIPHSHPVLTMSARHIKDDELLLSTYVHEQIHSHLVNLSKETDEAIKELRVLFPKVPAGAPEGARDENSTYLHLLVCYLEYRADRELMGELKAKQVIEFWSTDHYNWVYRIVLERTRDIGNIAFKYKLVPQQTSPPPK